MLQRPHHQPYEPRDQTATGDSAVKDTKQGGHRSEEQFGFKQNSGRREAIFTTRNIIETYISKQKDIYARFMTMPKHLIECNTQKSSNA